MVAFVATHLYQYRGTVLMHKAGPRFPDYGQPCARQARAEVARWRCATTRVSVRAAADGNLG